MLEQSYNPTEVEYGFTKNLGNYQSERLAIRVSLSDGQDATEAAAYARSWVEQHLTLSDQEVDETRYQHQRRLEEIQKWERDIEALRNQYDQLSNKMEGIGLRLPPTIEDLPF